MSLSTVRHPRRHRRIVGLLFVVVLLVGSFPATAASQPPLSDEVELIRALPMVSFSQPVFATAAPDGSNRLFIVEKAGRIRVATNDDATTAAPVFLDISAQVSSGGEQGLLGLAFAPDYTTSGYFYVYYSAASPRRAVVSRFQVSANPDVADANSESIVIEVGQPPAHSNHNAGMIAFGPDDMFYIALGDGGGGGNPLGPGGQDCSDMLGAILRIDPGAASPYQIPNDNPYAASGTHDCGTLSGAPARDCGIDGEVSGQICRELFAVGLRNPWRFSFDSQSGDLWAADVGQGSREEVDVVASGDNLGWPIFEGTQEFNNPDNLPASMFKAPIHDYPRSEGTSITGGYVYHGSALPALAGKYIYGDYGSDNIWALTFNGDQFVANEQFEDLAGLVSFGVDPAGELLAVSIHGQLYRFVAKVPGCDGIDATINMNTNGGDGMGTAGADVILGTPGDDVITARGGDDLVCGDGGDDVIRGGPGDDVISGGPGADVIRGGPGDDVISGGAGADVIRGAGGSDDIDGGGGDDEIDGQGGLDVIQGGSGNDVISGRGAADTISGGPGDDIIAGHNGADDIDGGTGDDHLTGQTGPDTLRGGDDDDTIGGGNGADILFGGAGSDRCSGNTGPDQAQGSSCEILSSIETLF